MLKRQSQGKREIRVDLVEDLTAEIILEEEEGTTETTEDLEETAMDPEREAERGREMEIMVILAAEVKARLCSSETLTSKLQKMASETFLKTAATFKRSELALNQTER